MILDKVAIDKAAMVEREVRNVRRDIGLSQRHKTALIAYVKPRVNPMSVLKWVMSIHPSAAYNHRYNMIYAWRTE